MNLGTTGNPNQSLSQKWFKTERNNRNEFINRPSFQYSERYTRLWTWLSGWLTLGPNDLDVKGSATLDQFLECRILWVLMFYLMSVGLWYLQILGQVLHSNVAQPKANPQSNVTPSGVISLASLVDFSKIQTKDVILWISYTSSKKSEISSKL